MRCVPPSTVLMLFTKENTDSAYPSCHWRAASTCVPSAGDAVQLVLELAARVHLRHHELGGGDAVLRVDLDGDPAAVVRDGHGPVHVDRDLDVLAEPDHRLVDRVVDDLVDEVMQAP